MLSQRNDFCQFVNVVTVINPCIIPSWNFNSCSCERFEFGMSLFVRTMKPNSGSSTSSLSAIYSKLNGFVDLFIFCDFSTGVVLSRLLVTSLHNRTISAIDLLKQSRSVISINIDPDRSLEHFGTSLILYLGCSSGFAAKRAVSPTASAIF